MERRQKAGVITILGLLLFLFSFIFILQIPELYLLSLVIMFIGVIMIGIGGAILKGFDKSLDEPTEECYYCRGTGIADDGITCARCGGTGLTPPDER